MRASGADPNARLHAQPSVRARLERRTNNAFADAERQGLMLAAKVRTFVLLLIILWMLVSSPDTGSGFLYSLAAAAAFAVLGVLQFICAKQRFHMHVLKYVFALVDCGLLALVISTPNPFEDFELPAAVAMDSSRASYFYILLVQAAFSLRPQLVLWSGLCIVAARTGMLIWFVGQPGVYTNIDMPLQTAQALLDARPDANFIYLGFWMSDILVTVVLTAGLAFVVRRSLRLVADRTIAERTRASLARYFSPNVVDHLSGTGQALGGVREQNVAVLFVDIVGFTKLCENASPDWVIGILRDYHNRLGQTVFDNSGTLDKYIGDGLMATFGTPEPGPDDARNALRCAIDMIAALERWNAERAAMGAVPIRIGIGLHYGSVIAGDIGNERRLEYSVIGDTVNIASRLEQLTRSLGTPLLVSDSLIAAMDPESDESKALIQQLREAGLQDIRGRESAVAVWILRTAQAA